MRPTVETAIYPMLVRDERLLWSGLPRGGLRFQSSDLLMIPFSLLWGGFAIAWEIGVIVAGAPVFFWLWGIPFVVLGLYLIAGRFFVDAYTRENTIYAVTNRRVIISTSVPRPHITSLPLDAISGLTLDGASDRADRPGTIEFKGTALPVHNPWAGYIRFPRSRRGKPPAPAFQLIDNARQVYMLIEHARSVTHAPAPNPYDAVA